MVLNEVTLYSGVWLNGVHRTCTKTAAVSHGTSHAATKECYPWQLKNMCYKKATVTNSESHATLHMHSESAQEQRVVLYKSDE